MSCTMVMALLHERVPLSLLCDLWDPDGPGSAEIMAVEAGLLDPQLTGAGNRSSAHP